MPFVPAGPLAAIFTSGVLAKLARVGAPSVKLDFRLRVLATHGPMPVEGPRDSVRHNRAMREELGDCYVTAAFACGLFDGQDARGK